MSSAASCSSCSSIGNCVAGPFAKYRPMRAWMCSTLPVGFRCMFRTRSLPGSSRHGIVGGSTSAVESGFQNRKCESGSKLCPLSIVMSMPGTPRCQSSGCARRKLAVRSRMTFAWCTTRGAPGLISMARIHFVSASEVGRTKFRNTSGPLAGTSVGEVTVSRRSGAPSCQSPVYTGGFGASATSPCGMPACTHVRIVAISASDMRRESAKSPCPGSGSHGGM